MVLTLLAVLVAALLGLAIAAAGLPRRVVTLGTAGIAVAVVLLVLAWLVAGSQPATMSLPIGPPGGAMHLALDPLGAAFLLLLFLPAIACAASAAAAPETAPVGPAAALAAMALIVLADDAFALMLGIAGLGIAGRLLPSLRGETDAPWDVAQFHLGGALVAVVCLVAALALAAPPGVPGLGCDFAAMRANPPGGWRAGVTLLLTLSGAMVLSGFFPPHGRITRPGGASALFAAIATNVGTFLLFRVLLDLCGAAQPVWWGVPLVLLGGAGAVFGPLRASVATRLEPLLAIGSLHQTGLAVLAVGLALFARAADLPQVAALALDAAWLLLVTHTLCRTLLLFCADVAERGAGTAALDRMGGLLHGMPLTGRCTLVGLFGVAMLPPGLGFAGLWLLFQALLAVVRIGGVGLEVLIAFAVLAAALSAGLAAMAVVRVAGVALLGRPRTPRAAVAEDAPGPLRLPLIGLTALIGLFSVFPGLVLLPAAHGFGRLANGSGLGMVLVLRPGVEAPGYAPAAISVVLVLAWYAMLWLSRHRGPDHRRKSAWSGGFAPPPPWLPFGEPTTQIGAASFATPMHRLTASWVRWPAPPGVIARLCRELRRGAETVGQPGLTWPIAAMLAALVLVVAVWLVAP